MPPNGRTPALGPRQSPAGRRQASDPHALNIPDDDHSEGEERWVLLGVTQDGRLLLIVHTDLSPGAIRVISARTATRNERAAYQARLKRCERTLRLRSDLPVGRVGEAQ